MYKPETFHIFMKLTLLTNFAKVSSLKKFRLYSTEIPVRYCTQSLITAHYAVQYSWLLLYTLDGMDHCIHRL